MKEVQVKCNTTEKIAIDDIDKSEGLKVVLFNEKGTHSQTCFGVSLPRTPVRIYRSGSAVSTVSNQPKGLPCISYSVGTKSANCMELDSLIPKVALVVFQIP